MLKNSFETLSLRDKIFLYIIVLIVFFLLFIVLEKFVFIDSKEKPVQCSQTLSIKSLSDKIVIKKEKEIFEYIEHELSKGDIFINSMSVTKQTITLDIKGSFISVMTILHQLESHLIIEELFFSHNKLQEDSLQINVIFLNHYLTNPNKTVQKIKTIINPFEHKSREENITIKEQIKPILLDAIVGDEVFIEGNWYKKDDSYLNYKIVMIEKNFINLLDNQTDTLKIIRLENE